MVPCDVVSAGGVRSSFCVRINGPKVRRQSGVAVEPVDALARLVVGAGSLAAVVGGSGDGVLNVDGVVVATSDTSIGEGADGVGGTVSGSRPATRPKIRYSMLIGRSRGRDGFYGRPDCR